MGLKTREPKTYASIISDGTIRVKSNENDPQAVRRDYELKNGTKGTKWERVYHELSGKITAMAFFDGDFGRTFNVTVSDAGEDIILVMNVEQNYAEDLLKKIPNLDFDMEVTLKPYSFEDDKGKLRRGISVNQADEKIKSFFHDDKNNPINGFPTIDQNKKYDRTDWKIYFMTVKKFLQEYTENEVFPSFYGVSTDAPSEEFASLEDQLPDKIEFADGSSVEGKIIEE